MGNKKLKCALILATLITSLLIGCDFPKENNEKEVMAGYITSAGSTSIQPLVEKSAEKFKLKYPNLNIMIQGGGSSSGLSQVIKGDVDIGNSDITADIKLNQQQVKTLVDNKIAVEGFAVVTSKDITIKSLTKKELIEIFSGKKTNWKDFGGDDKKILVIHGDKSSGKRNIFTEKILGAKQFENDKIGITQDSTSNIKTSLETTKGAISYIGLSYLIDEKSKELINVLNIDNVEANYENIVNGSYLFWSYAHMYTREEEKKITKKFIDYIKSEENKETLKGLGFIPINDIK